MGDAWATAQVFLNGAARERGIHVLGQAREAARHTCCARLSHRTRRLARG
jgi:hypothetical protein